MGHQNQITLNWRELYQSKEDLAILDNFTVIAVGKGTTVSSKHIIMHSNNPHCMGGGRNNMGQETLLYTYSFNKTILYYKLNY